MADEFALALLNRTNPEPEVLPDVEILDVPVAPEVASAARPLHWSHLSEVRKRSEGKSVVFLSAYVAGRRHGEYSLGHSKAEAKQAAGAFYQGMRDGRKGPDEPLRYHSDWEITADGLQEAWPDNQTPTEKAATAIDGKGNRGTTVALIALGGAALAGLAAAFLSARSSGKKTAVKRPQLSDTPPAPTGFVPPAAPPVAEPPERTPPARTSSAQPQPEYTPTPSNRPVSVPPITLNPMIRFDFGPGEWNLPQNTGIVPPVDFVQKPDSTRTEVPDASEYFSPGEQRWLDAAGYSVNSEASPQEFGYVQTGDPLVPDLSPEQYSKMWLDAYNEGYKYGQRLKPGEAETKVVSLVHIDGQRAGFLGQPAKPPSADADKAEYLQGYELGKAITDKAAGGVALVKAEASAWGSWDAVRGVPARSGPPAYHASAASA